MTWLAVLACASPSPADTASGTDTAPPPGRAVSGTFVDAAGDPITGLRVTASGDWCIPDATDAEGRFLVEQVTDPEVRLLTYGETADDGPVASLSLDLAGWTGGDLDVGTLVAPRLAEAIALDPTRDATVVTADGLELDIAAGSLSLAPLAEPVLRVARLDPSQLPPFGPDAGTPVDGFALDPIRSTLDPPAPARFPGRDDLSPGTAVSFWSLDYDLGRLVPVAVGEVGDDGRPATAPGQGLPELTWVVLTLD